MAVSNMGDYEARLGAPNASFVSGPSGPNLETNEGGGMMDRGSVSVKAIAISLRVPWAVTEGFAEALGVISIHSMYAKFWRVRKAASMKQSTPCKL